MELKRGFTLAEVLITLGIIGVVASMTIPTLMNYYAKQTTAEKLKKVYSTILQANSLSSVDNGPISTWFGGLAGKGSTGALNFANTYIIPYLKIAKNCGLSTGGECTENIYYLNPANSPDIYSYSASTAKFYMSDGTFISVVNDFDANSRVIVVVDINGSAKPNTYGKDVFTFSYYVAMGQFLPSAYMQTRDQLIDPALQWACNKNSDAGGTRCAALIMQDSWQIKNDYPW